jgi:hypothetical protein
VLTRGPDGAVRVRRPARTAAPRAVPPTTPPTHALACDPANLEKAC